MEFIASQVWSYIAMGIGVYIFGGLTFKHLLVFINAAIKAFMTKRQKSHEHSSMQEFKNHDVGGEKNRNLKMLGGLLSLLVALTAALKLLPPARQDTNKIQDIQQRATATASASPNVSTSSPITININIINELRSAMNGKGFKGKEFRIIPDSESEDGKLVKNLPGNFYRIIRLKNEMEEIMHFDSAQYEKDRRSTEFREFYSDLKKKLFDHLDEHAVTHRLYFLGRADIKGNNASELGTLQDWVPPSVIVNERVNPLNTNQFDAKQVNFLLPRKYRNIHLPNLRAWYMKKLISQAGVEHGKSTESLILDGIVTKRENEDDRNAEMYLYVEWGSNSPHTNALR